MKSLALIAAIIFLILGIAAGYYYFFYPPKVLERKTQDALDHLSKAVASKDRAKISDTLQHFLTDSTQIKLEISFSSFGQVNGDKPVIQDFNKPDFINFIDNILYSMKDYAYALRLREFHLNPTLQTATVTFTSKEWAEGASYYGGSAIPIRYSSDTSCEGQVIFNGADVQLKKAQCKTQLRMAPKAAQ